MSETRSTSDWRQTPVCVIGSGSHPGPEKGPHDVDRQEDHSGLFIQQEDQPGDQWAEVENPTSVETKMAAPARMRSVEYR